MSGWIKLHRALTDHWIYQDAEALKLWFTLLCDANHKSAKSLFNGTLIEVKRGQLIFGRKVYAEKTGVSENKIRRFMELMESEEMIHQQKTNRYTLVTVLSYEQYQAKEPANQQPATIQPPHLKNDKNVKNRAHEKFTPPTVEEVRNYCDSRGNGIDPEAFVAHYDSANWMRGKTKIKNWKSCVITWEKNQRSNAPQEEYRGGGI